MIDLKFRLSDVTKLPLVDISEYVSSTAENELLKRKDHKVKGFMFSLDEVRCPAINDIDVICEALSSGFGIGAIKISLLGYTHKGTSRVCAINKGHFFKPVELKEVSDSINISPDSNIGEFDLVRQPKGHYRCMLDGKPVEVELELSVTLTCDTIGHLVDSTCNVYRYTVIAYKPFGLMPSNVKVTAPLFESFVKGKLSEDELLKQLNELANDHADVVPTYTQVNHKHFGCEEMIERLATINSIEEEPEDSFHSFESFEQYPIVGARSDLTKIVTLLNGDVVEHEELTVSVTYPKGVSLHGDGSNRTASLIIDPEDNSVTNFFIGNVEQLSRINRIKFYLKRLSDESHVNNFIYEHVAKDDNEKYAKEWLYKKSLENSLPANIDKDSSFSYITLSTIEHLKGAFKLDKLFCLYEGKCYRVVGMSRMGDIWLNDADCDDDTYTYAYDGDRPMRVYWNQVTSFSSTVMLEKDNA